MQSSPSSNVNSSSSDNHSSYYPTIMFYLDIFWLDNVSLYFITCISYSYSVNIFFSPSWCRYWSSKLVLLLFWLFTSTTPPCWDSSQWSSSYSSSRHFLVQVRLLFLVFSLLCPLFVE